MFEIILVSYLAYSNNVRAKLKGVNGILWGAITAGAFFAAFILGGFVVIYNFCGDLVNIDAFSSPDVQVRTAAANQLMTVMNNNPLHLATIELFGIGGYLLVRYILEKKPGKKEPEVHWMDKMGQQ